MAYAQALNVSTGDTSQKRPAHRHAESCDRVSYFYLHFKGDKRVSLMDKA